MIHAPKLLLDEMLSGRIAKRLQAKGHDVLAVVDDPALLSTHDEDLLRCATAAGRCVVTANVRDFALLSTQWRAAGRVHAGLVYVPSRAFPQDRSLLGAVVGALVRLLESENTPGPGSDTFLRREPS